jgi:hypothetical protein
MPEQADERRDQQQREDCGEDALKQRHGTKALTEARSTTTSGIACFN